MWFPQNPKVLILDDHYKEVKPLLQIFSSKGVPYVYFDASPDAEPVQPFSGIRLVILDIELEGKTNSSMDDKSIASALVVYLKKIIDIKHSSYAILFWTKRTGVIENVLNYLEIENGKPITWFDMEKPAEIDLTLDYVKEKFFSEFHNDIFEFLLTWEDSISKNAAEFVNHISKIVKQESKIQNKQWDESMKNVLTKLALSYLGKKSIKGTQLNEAVKYATELFNRSFLEELKIDNLPKITLLEKAKLSLNTIAKLNEFLFIEKINDHTISNGKIFLFSNDNLHNTLKKIIIRNSELDDWETDLEAVILTPNCDLAHNKFLKEENGKEHHRALFGLKIIIKDSIDSCFEYNAKRSTRKKDINSIIEIDESFSKALEACDSSAKFDENQKKELEAIKQKIKKLEKLKIKIMERFPEERPEYLYVTQPFMDKNNKIAIFAFHFGTIRTISIDTSSITFDYLLKGDLISDLQTKLANHINRLGNSMLEI